MICPNQSNRGPLKEEKKELKCGTLPTADIVGAVGKREQTLNLPIFNLNMSVREGQLPLIFSQIQKLPDDDPRGGRGEA